MFVAPALRALLSGVLDYAGMFPPADLPLEAAVRNFAGYRSEPASWMLARFVCPAARLADLGPHVAVFSEASPLRVAALGRTSRSLDDFVGGVRASLQYVNAFRDAHGPSVAVDTLDLPLPPAVEVSLFTVAAGLVESDRPEGMTLFYEAPASMDWRSSVEDTLDALAAHNAQQRRQAGFKLRTGGVTPSAFPSPESVARTIVACRDRSIALKFTAGLHHPLRRYDSSVQTKMHGFLNVFVAGVLAHARALEFGEVQFILEEEKSESFGLGPEGLTWRGVRATVDEIAAARQSAVLSFGSCSFVEPRDDLRALGLLHGGEDGRHD
jgi:hypothetical protein